MHEGDGAAQLHRDVRHLRGRVRHVAVALEEVEHGLAQHLERQADVAVVARKGKKGELRFMFTVQGETLFGLAWAIGRTG